MKKVVIVKIESLHIDNETCQPIKISFEQSAIDQITGTNKFSFVEVYTLLDTLKAKTFRKLSQDVEIWMAERNNYDIHAILVK